MINSPIKNNFLLVAVVPYCSAVAFAPVFSAFPFLPSRPSLPILICLVHLNPSLSRPPFPTHTMIFGSLDRGGLYGMLGIQSTFLCTLKINQQFHLVSHETTLDHQNSSSADRPGNVLQSCSPTHNFIYKQEKGVVPYCSSVAVPLFSPPFHLFLPGSDGDGDGDGEMMVMVMVMVNSNSGGDCQFRQEKFKNCYCRMRQ